MRHSRNTVAVSASTFAFLFGTVLFAQESELAALSSWVAIDAPTGHEHLAIGRFRVNTLAGIATRMAI